MRTTIACFALFFIIVAAKAQTANPNYNEALAKSLNADDYGMKSYVLAILKTGENLTATKEESSKAFAGHLKNIEILVNEGKMILAGPLGKNDKTYRGIFIFDVPTIEEATKLVNTDPAIKARLLAVDFYEWYGSAALAEYLPVSDKIWKVKP
jgi:uncharacterized protein YciI